MFTTVLGTTPDGSQDLNIVSPRKVALTRAFHSHSTQNTQLAGQVFWTQSTNPYRDIRSHLVPGLSPIPD